MSNIDELARHRITKSRPARREFLDRSYREWAQREMESCQIKHEDVVFITALLQLADEFGGTKKTFNETHETKRIIVHAITGGKLR